MVWVEGASDVFRKKKKRKRKISDKEPSVKEKHRTKKQKTLSLPGSVIYKLWDLSKLHLPCLFSVLQALHTTLLGHTVLFCVSESQLWMTFPTWRTSLELSLILISMKVPPFPCPNESHPAVGSLNTICNLILARQCYLCLSISSRILAGRDQLIFVHSELSNTEKHPVEVCEIKDKSVKGWITNWLHQISI